MKNDSAAWQFQVWLSFIAAVVTTGVGIYALPVDIWMRSFLGMGLLFSVGSTLSLAKTMRDMHEASKLIGKIDEAKTEKLLREYQ